MQTKKFQIELATELMSGCPAESRDDHQAIADAITRGDNADAIMRMPELDRWPETYAWLHGHLIA